MKQSFAGGACRPRLSGLLRRARLSRASALLALVLTLVTAVPARARVIERIVAVVNDEIVLLSELQSRIGPFLAQIASVPDAEQRKVRAAQLRSQVLEQMVDDKLIAQQARTHKLTVEEADLERAVDEVMRRNNLTREQLTQALAQEGQTLASYKQQMLRPQLLRLKVLNVQVRSRVAVSDDELRALYQHNLRALDVETKVQARQIFLAVPPAALPQQVASRRALAERLAQQLKQGADFAQLAQQYSDDPETRAKGGELGTLSRGMLPVTIEDAVFSAKGGELRGPLATPRGFYLIQVTHREDSAARPFEEVREQLRDQLYAQKMEQATKSWLREVRKKAFIDLKR
ncbi:MAG: peptidylprolyl isomerase [Proteobacteria bacterium]|nr:peptidylprolyl isomerase [Pseudomonadota bacterium]